MIIKAIHREIEEQNQINEAGSSISGDQNAEQPGSRGVSIPMAGDTYVNGGFQSTDGL